MNEVQNWVSEQGQLVSRIEIRSATSFFVSTDILGRHGFALNPQEDGLQAFSAPSGRLADNLAASSITDRTGSSGGRSRRATACRFLVDALMRAELWSRAATPENSQHADLLARQRTKTPPEMFQTSASHSSYHLGQVVLLRLRLVAWPPPLRGLTQQLRREQPVVRLPAYGRFCPVKEAAGEKRTGREYSVAIGRAESK